MPAFAGMTWVGGRAWGARLVSIPREVGQVCLEFNLLPP